MLLWVILHASVGGCLSFDYKSSLLICRKNFALPAAMSADLVLTSAAAASALVKPTMVILKHTFDVTTYILNLCFICRTVLSWYPNKNIGKLPYSLVVIPTEPLLAPVRKAIPPAFGVDISAIICLMALSFLHEILSGPQGILEKLVQ